MVSRQLVAPAVQQAIIDCPDYIKMVQNPGKSRLSGVSFIPKRADIVAPFDLTRAIFTQFLVVKNRTTRERFWGYF